MENIKDKIRFILEHSNCDKPLCVNCKSYKNGGCSFGCLNEKVRITSPNYSCRNYQELYEYNENTLDALKTLLKDIESVDERKKNLELFLSGKINESEFVDLVD